MDDLGVYMYPYFWKQPYQDVNVKIGFLRAMIDQLIIKAGMGADACWFNGWLYILSNDTDTKKHFKRVHNSPLLHQMYWHTTMNQKNKNPNLWPAPIYMISLSHSPKPNPTSKIKLTPTFNLVFPPPYFLHQKSASKVAIVAITHCKDTSFSPGLAQRFVATRPQCHLYYQWIVYVMYGYITCVNEYIKHKITNQKKKMIIEP